MTTHELACIAWGFVAAGLMSPIVVLISIINERNSND